MKTILVLCLLVGVALIWASASPEPSVDGRLAALRFRGTYTLYEARVEVAPIKAGFVPSET